MKLSAIFISPTMELDVIGSEAFAEGWRGRPVLVIQGDRDANVRPASVTAACERMESEGVRVTTVLTALALAKNAAVVGTIPGAGSAFGPVQFWVGRDNEAEARDLLAGMSEPLDSDE